MKLLIVTQRPCELSALMEEVFSGVQICTPENMPTADLCTFSAIAVLGGAQGDNPLLLLPPQRRALEECLKNGVRIFAEFVWGIGDANATGTESTRYARPVCVDASPLGLSLEKGLLFEEQSNTRIVLRKAGCPAQPILQYHTNPRGFYVMEEPETIVPDESRYALWMDQPGLLVCAFRMANFASAKFSPQRIWAALISAILRWLGGQCTEETVMTRLASAYHMRRESSDPVSAAKVASSWFDRAGMLISQGGEAYAVKEGLQAHVRPDGEHVIAAQLRPDCAGETALMYFLLSMLENDKTALRRADGLMRFPRDMQTTHGLRAGWVSWTPTASFACYQDDVARGFLLPELWRALLSGDYSRLPSVKLTLDFLLSTTGSDGLRMCRTDYIRMDDPRLQCMGIRQNTAGKWSFQIIGEYLPEELRSMPSGCPSAHYNGFYLASLLLYAKLSGDAAYLAAGRKGLRSIMALYPQNGREHSETQELCRLILPLAMLHWVSDNEEEKQWLYRITEDLLRFRHPCGGYAEWDTGYISVCAGVKDGESSVLCKNGDPVADLLYSVNWLPMGFAAAYLATKDLYFKKLWQDIADFFARSQLISDDPRINGAWPRSMDMDRFEVYGVPNDVGWAPWSVESGWTVAEIASGLLLGSMMDKIAL